jgi:hypothetical protein
VSKSFKSGLQYQEYRNDIKGALLPRFARIPLMDLLIIGTLNQQVSAFDQIQKTPG